MEFLPPDVAPLHDPASSKCVPRVCIDPRRSAEEACGAALAQFDGPNPVDRLSLDIERALNDPDVYQLPRIAKRAQQAWDLTDKAMERVRAGTLLATAPLFELRQQNETSDIKMHEAYMALAGLANRFSFKGVIPQLRRGIEAEIAMHAILLRGGRNVPYLTSPREEASSQSLLNNDLGLYSPTTGSTEKVPVQIKRSNGSRKKFTENRVLPIIAERACALAVAPIIDIAKTRHQDYVDLIFNMIAQESHEGPFAATSQEGKVLNTLADTLNDDIDTHRELFKEAIGQPKFGYVLQGLIDSAFGDRPGVIAKAAFRESQYTQLSSGAYIFFNRLTAIRREHASDPDRNEYRLTFGLNDLILGSIEYSSVNQALVCTSSQKIPNDITIELLQPLLHIDIPWEQQ